MRRFAWYMYYKVSGRNSKGQKGKKKSQTQAQAEFWRNLALTRKQKLAVKIPKRQFIGESAELTQHINEKIKQEIINTLDL